MEHLLEVIDTGRPSRLLHLWDKGKAELWIGNDIRYLTIVPLARHEALSE
jgi:hypothetical protein